MKKATFCTVTVILALIFFLFERPEMVYQPIKPVFSPPEKVKTIVAIKGDTLSHIAAKYSDKNITWQYIAKLNGMDGSTLIRVGQKLLVPDDSPDE